MNTAQELICDVQFKIFYLVILAYIQLVQQYNFKKCSLPSTIKNVANSISSSIIIFLPNFVGAPSVLIIYACRWPMCQRICMCRSHQSVAILLGRSCMCLEKTLTQQLQAIGGRGWRDTTPCTVNWSKKVRGARLASFELLYGLSEFRCQ